MKRAPKVAASFLDEADERLENATRILLEVEAARVLDSDHASELQRALHNLKGAARMVALTRFERLVHIQEDFVKCAGAGAMELSVMIQLLLEGVDELGTACRRMRESGRIFDAEELDMTIAKFEIFLPGEDEVVARRSSEPTSAPGDARVCRYDPSTAEESLDDFIAEALEMFEQMQNACVSLEDHPMPEAVDGLFRVAHTLKGSSGAIGLVAMKTVMHRLEEQLDDVRRDVSIVTPELVDLLLTCLDECTAILDKLRTRRSFEHDIGPIMARLDGWKTGAARSPDEVRAETLSSDSKAKMGAAGSEAARGSSASEIARSIRVDVGKLDAVINLVGELAITKIRFERRVTELEHFREELADRLRRLPRNPTIRHPAADLDMMNDAFIEHLDEQRRSRDELHRISGALQTAVMRTRMIPVGQILTRFQRLIRDFSKAAGKPLRLEVLGEETEIDKTVAECIGDPLMHIIRNAADHGIEAPADRMKAGKPESGLIKIEAMCQGDLVVIEISDDGAGISREKVLEKALGKRLLDEEEAARMSEVAVHELLFRPGFSTAERVTDISGRGVGLDVVRNNISRLKGTVTLRSVEGEGTKFTIMLPLTLAVIQALIVKVGRHRFALPLTAVQETVLLADDEIHAIGTKESFNLRSEAVSLVHLGRFLGFHEESWRVRHRRNIVVGTAGFDRVGLEVDGFEGRQEVVIKTVGTLLKNVRFIAGTTIMGDGSLVLIVDLPEVVRAARGWEDPAAAKSGIAAPRKDDPGAAEIAVPRVPTYLLVDDSPTVLNELRRTIEKLGVRVLSAGDGEAAMEILDREKIDAVVTDVNMPKLDGYELCRRIRASPAIEHLPVVMISANGETLDRKRGFDAGADDYLTKPFDPAMLAAKLEGFLNPRASLRRAE